jgi:two-component system phosphate regulon sensor histidine kinase PhoR
LILDGYVPEPKIPETLAKAERRAMEQLALIADLLELGRVGSTEARAQIGPVQVDALLREQADLFAPAAHERGITLEMAIQPDLPPVQANPEQIKSLWGNLLSNALKYNRDGGRIEVALEHVDDRLLACVADTGIGIPPEALPRLFAEFFRADNAKASDRTGTGLGLSIVKEIVTHTGGQISVESQLGAGTTFRFWLPAPGAQAPAAPSSPVFSPGGA